MIKWLWGNMAYPIFFVAFILNLAFGISGCSLTSGERVTEKTWYYDIYSDCSVIGEMTTCSGTSYSGVKTYLLWVDTGNWFFGETTFPVSEEVYNSCSVGDIYYPEGCVKR